VSGARAVFVDRDGVVNELVSDPPESSLSMQDVSLIPGAAEALKRLASAGWLLIGVSNQPAAAKGIVALEELEGVQAHLLELLTAEGVRFDDFRICWHHPEGVVPALSGACRCRKPAPGMLLDAAFELGIDLAGSWMVGDTDADILASEAAGCRGVLVENERSAHKRDGRGRPDAVVPDLEAAADVILHIR